MIYKMKKTIILLLIVMLLFGGCQKQQLGSSGQGAFDYALWEEERRALQHETIPPPVVPTAIQTDESLEPGVATEVAAHLAVTLAFYPTFGKDVVEAVDFPEEMLRLTALYTAKGSRVGDWDAGSRQVLTMDERLGYPGQFIAKEQVQAVLYEYFDLPGEIAHKDTKITKSSNDKYMYNEEYGVYLYPEEPPLPYAPVLVDCRQTFDAFSCLVVFVPYADQEGLSVYDSGENVVAGWEIAERITENPQEYTWYTVSVLRTAEGKLYVERVEPL